MLGAMIGARPMISTRRDIRMAPCCPSVRSRTTARLMTMPADAPKAATKRSTASMVIDWATAPPAIAAANTMKPPISGHRRPSRSESVPCRIWPTAKPANQAASVYCAVPAPDPKVASTAGKAGKYMSVAAGPTAMQ